MSPDNAIVAQLIALVDAAGLAPHRGAHVLRRAARELERQVPTVLPAPTPSRSEPPIPAGVPDELWLSVLAGAVEEEVAIARGLLAAGARTEQERRTILFDQEAGREDTHDDDSTVATDGE